MECHLEPQAVPAREEACIDSAKLLQVIPPVVYSIHLVVAVACDVPQEAVDNCRVELLVGADNLVPVYRVALLSQYSVGTLSVLCEYLLERWKFRFELPQPISYRSFVWHRLVHRLHHRMSVRRLDARPRM